MTFPSIVWPFWIISLIVEIIITYFRFTHLFFLFIIRKYLTSISLPLASFKNLTFSSIGILKNLVYPHTPHIVDPFINIFYIIQSIQILICCFFQCKSHQSIFVFQKCIKYPLIICIDGYTKMIFSICLLEFS